MGRLVRHVALWAKVHPIATRTRVERILVLQRYSAITSAVSGLDGPLGVRWRNHHCKIDMAR